MEHLRGLGARERRQSACGFWVPLPLNTPVLLYLPFPEGGAPLSFKTSVSHVCLLSFLLHRMETVKIEVDLLILFTTVPLRATGT